MKQVEADNKPKVLCDTGTCLECDSIKVEAFDDLVAALKMYKAYRESGLAGRASKQAQAARVALHDAVDAALQKAGGA
jgi:hypothetical protein